MRKVYKFIIGIIMLGSFNCQLQAQSISPDSSSEKINLNRVGFTFGVGASTMNLRNLNRRLNELKVGTLDPDLFSGTVGFQHSINPGLELGFDLNVSATNANKIYQQGTGLSLFAFTFGTTIYKYLLQADRFALIMQLGYRNTSMSFEHKTNKDTPANFNGIFGAPAATANIIRLESQNNRGVLLGLRGQYRLGKNNGGKSENYYLGLDTGYNYFMWNNAWREANTNNKVEDMPSVKPNNLYFQVTLSRYFN